MPGNGNPAQLQCDAVFNADAENHERKRNTGGNCKAVSDEDGAESENPGALAGASGAVCEVGHFKSKSYPKAGAPSSKRADGILSKYMKPEHKRMSRMLGYCLTLDTPEAWAGFRFVSQVRLTEGERAMLAYFALTSLAPDHVEMTAAAVIGAAGDPLPPFLGGMEDARFWASWASPNELKAYALACFEAMEPKDQAAFYRHIGAMEVAA